jgi:hypothetical protein
VAGKPPMSMTVPPGVVENPDPVTVNGVPPEVEPEEGVTPVTVGMGPVTPGGVVVVVDVVLVVVVDVVLVVLPTGAAVVVVVVLGGVVGQFGSVMTLASRVTAPLLTSTRPVTEAPVSMVAALSARMLPSNVVPVPSVAALPTCQNTLHAEAPLIRLTVLFVAVVSVELAWKMNTALALFWPSNVSVPVRLSEEAEAW